MLCEHVQVQLLSLLAALFVASKLEQVSHSLDDMWKCISLAVSCNASLLGNSSRDQAVDIGRMGMRTLEPLKNHEHPDLLESTLLLARSLMSTCLWEELEHALTLATMQAASHKRKRLQVFVFFFVVKQMFWSVLKKKNDVKWFF